MEAEAAGLIQTRLRYDSDSVSVSASADIHNQTRLLLLTSEY